MSDDNSETQRRRIRFYYIKSQQFRVAHVDGAVGGLTPNGLIHMAVYSERPAIPQSTEHDLPLEGQIGDTLDQEGKQGIVREVDIDLMMSREAATHIRDWLNDRISDLDRILATVTPASKTPTNKRKR